MAIRLKYIMQQYCASKSMHMCFSLQFLLRLLRFLRSELGRLWVLSPQVRTRICQSGDAKIDKSIIKYHCDIVFVRLCITWSDKLHARQRQCRCSYLPPDHVCSHHLVLLLTDTPANPVTGHVIKASVMTTTTTENTIDHVTTTERISTSRNSATADMSGEHKPAWRHVIGLIFLLNFNFNIFFKFISLVLLKHWFCR